MSKRSLLLGIMAASALAACDHEVSIVLYFPNEISRQATERLVVEVYPAAGRPNACDDYLPLAATGGSPLSDYVARGDYEFTGSGADLILTKVPAIAQVVYVVGYPTREETPTPILVGCAGDFDPSKGADQRKEVPVVLETVFPKTTSLRAVSGNRQVGRPGELLRPMTVALRGEVSKLDYGIPGVPIDFEAMRGFEIVGDGDVRASSARVLTDEEGRASVLVRAPTALDLYLDVIGDRVVVEASFPIPTGPAASGLPAGAVLEAQFLASSTPKVQLGVVAELSGRARSVPVDLLVTPLWRTPPGSSSPVLEPSVLVLGCEGIESDTGCLAGDRAVRPFGTASVSIFHDLLGDGDRLDLPTGDGGLDLGILPQAILAFSGETSAAGTDIVLLNSRYSPEPNPHPCDTKPTANGCGDAGPCVGSWSEACDVAQRAQLRSIHLDPTGAATVTSSVVTLGRNAVAMTAYETTDSGSGELVNALAVVVAGREANVRQCSVPNQCRSRPVPSCGSKIGDVCDCWPGESCECPGCSAGEALGLCTVPDRIVDFAKLNASRTLGRWIPCVNPTLECDPLEPSKSECSCSPDPPGGGCPGDSADGRDRCGCRIPVRSWIGGRISAGGGTSRPNSVAAADVAGLRVVVVASDGVGGLELMEGVSASGYPAFEWEDRPAVNLAAAKASLVSVDTSLDPRPDVVWYARQPCSQGFADSATCPIEGVGPSGRGCFGALLTGGSAADALSARAKGACVRYSVRSAPDGMCLADFNADGAIDVALASRDDSALLVYAGNGLGGFRDPPEVFELGGVGGPMDCHDLDPGMRSDGEEAIVVDRGSGRLRVLKRRE